MRARELNAIMRRVRRQRADAISCIERHAGLKGGSLKGGRRMWLEFLETRDLVEIAYIVLDTVRRDLEFTRAVTKRSQRTRKSVMSGSRTRGTR